MSELNFRDLCCLFCCPPFPSKIAAKLAFLPPQKTYEVSENECGDGSCMLTLTDRAEWQYGDREKELIDVFYAKTSRGNQISCFYVRATYLPKYTILFSHGNAVDIGQMSSFFLGLGSRLDCNVLGYDYSGYGCSGGSASEKNLYSDIDAAWNALKTKYSISPDRIILYGQSIGTVPTVDLASRVKCAGVVLHSPLMSGMRVAFPNTNRTWCFDAFPSIEKVAHINSKLLVIHGTEDEVIDFTHGLAMHAKCKSAVEPLWVEGAGHNDIELYSSYLERLKKFICDDVKQVELNGSLPLTLGNGVNSKSKRESTTAGESSITTSGHGDDNDKGDKSQNHVSSQSDKPQGDTRERESDGTRANGHKSTTLPVVQVNAS